MNRVIHFEIHAKDLDVMQLFYQYVFGWDIKNIGPHMSGYRVVVTGRNEQYSKWPGINGGITPRQGNTPNENSPLNAFVCIIDVEDIDDTLEKIASAGGAVVTNKTDVHGVGQLAYRKDPDGNIFGVLQPVKAIVSNDF